MGDDIQRDADDHETVFRTVSGLDGKSMIHEHDIQKVTPTKVYVHQKPRSGDVMGFYKTRQGGTYVLDRRKLEESGRYRTEYGATQTSFYLERSDVEEEVETPGSEADDEAADDEGADEAGADEDERRPSEPELRPVPVEALEGTVVDYFEQIASDLNKNYDGALTNRLLLETSLRQSLLDFHMHSKDSPLMQQLDSISMARDAAPADPDLQAIPVDQMHADLVTYLNKAAAALDARYEKGFPKRRLIEVSLRQVFADLRMYQQEAVMIRWLDVLLLE
ncbi:hypothetical protein GGP65_002345 [Salinibacter ruber]|uniref:hypothetical protein n=1 Tax=Salinibacter ruber TaxID=146919 RepID=UPI00216A7565|nr:hypothetical protein [Salinibacter ruber]MCS3664715.1 hypothetical protein [Salinibacter ruber]